MQTHHYYAFSGVTCFVIAVEVFECSRMAAHCDSCLALPPRFSCVWCPAVSTLTTALESAMGCSRAEHCQSIAPVTFCPHQLLKVSLLPSSLDAEFTPKKRFGHNCAWGRINTGIIVRCFVSYNILLQIVVFEPIPVNAELLTKQTIRIKIKVQWDLFISSNGLSQTNGQTHEGQSCSILFHVSTIEGTLT